jgi:hypothetical protein
MKADRDANFIEKNADGVTVNRWPPPVSSPRRPPTTRPAT